MIGCASPVVGTAAPAAATWETIDGSADSKTGEVGSVHRRFRVPFYARHDDLHLPRVWRPEVVRLRGATANPDHQSRTADLLALSHSRHTRRRILPRHCRMA